MGERRNDGCFCFGVARVCLCTACLSACLSTCLLIRLSICGMQTWQQHHQSTCIGDLFRTHTMPMPMPMPCHAMPCPCNAHAMPCLCLCLCHAMPCHAMLCLCHTRGIAGIMCYARFDEPDCESALTLGGPARPRQQQMCADLKLVNSLFNVTQVCFNTLQLWSRCHRSIIFSFTIERRRAASSGVASHKRRSIHPRSPLFILLFFHGIIGHCLVCAVNRRG
jgi:hypothetical protein